MNNLAIVALFVLKLGLPFLAPAPNDSGTLEVNHVYRTDGEHNFTQAVYRKPDGEILAWRYWRPHLMAYATLEGDYMFGWWEGQRRYSFAGQVVQTQTFYDVEVAEREQLPEEYRRGLRFSEEAEPPLEAP